MVFNTGGGYLDVSDSFLIINIDLDEFHYEVWVCSLEADFNSLGLVWVKSELRWFHCEVCVLLWIEI